MWAPGTERTAWAPGTERALERTLWALWESLGINGRMYDLILNLLFGRIIQVRVGTKFS